MITEIVPNLYLSDMYDAARLKDKRVKQIMMAPIPTDEQKKLDDPVLLNLNPDYNFPMTDYSPELTPQNDPNYAGSPKNMGLLQRGVNTINQLLRKDQPVLVYCHAGMSRSPATIVKYLMDKKGLSFDDAYDLVEKKRGTVALNPAIELALRAMESEY